MSIKKINIYFIIIMYQNNGTNNIHTKLIKKNIFRDFNLILY